ncbi:hypothetical protein [Mycobacterium deserti]|uniref:Uncharacterized protein n=1 Tax=Mycobacterium deserti TaxID=2978347 RepID=A0ABT2MGU9_9MYCO|nr:hypothetical protein [Mycobacterium deserti]MCT7661514.1 hypothetical protein [Mycobacterium deserti]
MLVAVITLSVFGAPQASAQTTVEPPERPSAGAMFTDNPAIVDAHPMPVASWSRFADDRALAVHFTTGTPQCFGVHATTRETADTVTVELRSGTLPEAVGRACIMIALEGTLQVPLQAPLGDRRVLSVY